MRDHVLARDLDDLDAQVHPYHFLEEGNQQHQARPFDLLKAPQGKDHGPLILAQDLHGGPDQGQGQRDSHNRDKQDDIEGDWNTTLLLSERALRTVIPAYGQLPHGSIRTPAVSIGPFGMALPEIRSRM